MNKLILVIVVIVIAAINTKAQTFKHNFETFKEYLESALAPLTQEVALRGNHWFDGHATFINLRGIVGDYEDIHGMIMPNGATSDTSSFNHFYKAIEDVDLANELVKIISLIRLSSFEISESVNSYGRSCIYDDCRFYSSLLVTIYKKNKNKKELKAEKTIYKFFKRAANNIAEIHNMKSCIRVK